MYMYVHLYSIYKQTTLTFDRSIMCALVTFLSDLLCFRVCLILKC